MAKKSHESETIRQQKLARKEFLELKKMQRGDIDPKEDHPDEAKIMSPRDKLKNFWYYYGKIVIIGIVVMIGIAFCVDQCIKKPKYDIKVIYFTYEVIPDSITEQLADRFKEYCPDTNGDGKVNVSVINCSYNPERPAMEILTKLQALVAADEEATLFVVDDESIKYFDNIKTENTTFFSEKTAELPSEFLNGTGYTPTKKLTLTVRNNIAKDADTKAAKFIKTAEEIIKKLK